jgi:hypothetical protein
VRDGILLLVVSAALLASWPFRLVANEDRPPAEALTERLDALFQEVREGREVPTDPTELAPGIQGARLEVGAAARWVLAGEAGSDCYVLWWDESGVRRGRTLPSAMACEPTTTATSPRPQHFDRIGRAVDDPDGPYEWSRILPDPIRYRFWFMPAIIVGTGVALTAAARMVIALLTGNAPSASRR